MKPKQFATSGFLSLVLATLIFVASLFAFKLSIDEHLAKESDPAGQHHPEKKIPSEERAVLGVGAEGWTAIFTGGLFVFTMLLAVFTYRLFRITEAGIAEQAILAQKSLGQAARNAVAAEKAAIATKDSVVASNRAWIKPRIEVSNQPLLRLEGGLQFSVNIFAENIGNAPATCVDPNAWLLGFNIKPGRDPFTRHEENCQSSLKRPAPMNQTLWPGEKFPEVIGFGGWGIVVTMSKDDVDLALQAASPSGYVMLYVGGAINYTFPSDAEGRHQSTFFFQIGRRDLRQIDLNDCPIASSNLTLIKATFLQGNSAT